MSDRKGSAYQSIECLRPDLQKKSLRACLRPKRFTLVERISFFIERYERAKQKYPKVENNSMWKIGPSLHFVAVPFSFLIVLGMSLIRVSCTDFRRRPLLLLFRRVCKKKFELALKWRFWCRWKRIECRMWLWMIYFPGNIWHKLFIEKKMTENQKSVEKISIFN